jgi:Rps23 Pro-64 3,4-dihydroxylase Tpa1-like proline 4-hydroxylase
MIKIHKDVIDNCDEIVKKSESFFSSRVGGDVRICQGTVLTEEHLQDEQIKNLCDTIEALGKQYADENNMGSVQMENVQILHYTKGEGYFARHTDGGRSMNRALSCVCYLNDVEEGGETVFYSDITEIIKPIAGKIVFFPADHFHEAKVPISNDKHVAVTWFQFT